MKKCPYCAEEIQEEAILCRYCHSDVRIPPQPAKQTILLPPDDPDAEKIRRWTQPPAQEEKPVAAHRRAMYVALVFSLIAMLPALGQWDLMLVRGAITFVPTFLFLWLVLAVATRLQKNG